MNITLTICITLLLLNAMTVAGICWIVWYIASKFKDLDIEWDKSGKVSINEQAR